MNIETKFKVGDIVKHKFARSPTGIQAFEVLEIKTNTCYAGTQCFYYGRSIQAEKVFKNRFDEIGEFDWAVVHAISNDPHMPTAWQQMREDELIMATPEEIAVLKAE